MGFAQESLISGESGGYFFLENKLVTFFRFLDKTNTYIPRKVGYRCTGGKCTNGRTDKDELIRPTFRGPNKSDSQSLIKADI